LAAVEKQKAGLASSKNSFLEKKNKLEDDVKAKKTSAAVQVEVLEEGRIIASKICGRIEVKESMAAIQSKIKHYETVIKTVSREYVYFF
jgi:uncharacterized protein YoxC